ncbi:CD209 antigen-like protein 2 isoform X1 [Genypterus blacodes]|uniref:CD209 antigen-like protein 2 isoform X1 n=1 Tax=Genypterus blacodes TaxID=154954 RepID=UPI003F77316C
MSTSLSTAAREGLYTNLKEEEDEEEQRAGARRSAHSVSPGRLTFRQGSAGRYRMVSVCLATLCLILLISLIAAAAHYKNRPQGGDGATSETQIQKQTQNSNASALIATINKLQQEKAELQKERDELLAKLSATKAPQVIKPTAPPIVCSPDWVLFNSSCYFISRNTRDWPESQSYCQSQGGHLAIILSAEEQTFLWDRLPRGHWNAFWFGITDEHTEDQWKWVDGTPLVDSFWEVGEPNNHINEDCGYIVKTQVLKRVAVRSWYDAPCSMPRNFICEKEMGPGVSTASPH